MVDNPDYKGPWSPKMIENPAYKGPWVHPEIPNPEYKEDPSLHFRAKDVSYVGFELWQVKSGSIFDNIIITDSLAEAKKFADEFIKKEQAKEKAMFDKVSQSTAERRTGEEEWH